MLCKGTVKNVNDLPVFSLPHFIHAAPFLHLSTHHSPVSPNFTGLNSKGLSKITRIGSSSHRDSVIFWYLDEPWDHADWYYLIPAAIEIKKKLLSVILFHVIPILNYCFNKLYYDCKHLIVLIIVECRLGLVCNQRHRSRVQ